MPDTDDDTFGNSQTSDDDDGLNDSESDNGLGDSGDDTFDDFGDDDDGDDGDEKTYDIPVLPKGIEDVTENLKAPSDEKPEEPQKKTAPSDPKLKESKEPQKKPEEPDPKESEELEDKSEEPGPEESEEKSELEEKLEPKEVKKEIKNEIGIMLHLGLYSFTQYVDLETLKRSIENKGSEWYYRRLIPDSKEFKSIKGSEETKIYHKKKFKKRSYFDLKTYFDKTLKGFDFKKIFNELLNDNITYIILTAKHHDGFCLWPSNYADYKSENDFVKKFIDSARKRDIKVGLYYSWFEFGKKMDDVFFENIINPQIKELEKYKPDYWWFDGDSKIRIKSVKNKIYNVVKRLKTNAILNSHVPLAPLGNKNKTYDIKIYEQNKLPGKRLPFNWEYMVAIGKSKGYCKQQENVGNDDYKYYKTGENINDLYNEVASKNGNFLINFGLKFDGSFDKHEIKMYNDFIKNFEKVTPKEEPSIQLDELFDDVEKKIYQEKKEDYLDKPSTDRDILELNEYITENKEKEERVLFDKELIERDIENIKEFYKLRKKYNNRYISLRNKLYKRKIALFEFNEEVMKIKCCRPSCPGGKGVIFKKDKTKYMIDNKFIIKQNKLIITGCPACRDKEYDKKSYSYLYSYLNENKKKISKIKRLLSIQKNELVNDLFSLEDEEDDLEMEYELYDDFKNYYLKKDENLKIIEKKMLFNKKNIEEIEKLLSNKMKVYTELPRNDNSVIEEKVKLYKEILDIKKQLRNEKYDKIDEENNVIIEINKDEEYPEIYDITEDDNEISNPYLELKRNIYNIPDSLQIIL